MDDLKLKEIEHQNQLLKESVEQVFSETDMMQYEVELIARNKRLMGKTITEWVNYFKIPVTRNADPSAVAEYCSMIIEKLDTAYENKNKLEAQLLAFKMAYQQGHNEEVLREANHKGRKVVPKLETMEAVAAAKMGTWTLNVTRYEKAIAFFQSMIYKLNTNLQAVQTIAMCNGTLRKAEMGAY